MSLTEESTGGERVVPTTQTRLGDEDRSRSDQCKVRTFADRDRTVCSKRNHVSRSRVAVNGITVMGDP